VRPHESKREIGPEQIWILDRIGDAGKDQELWQANS